MNYINTSEKPNSGTGDGISIAVKKINGNFDEVFNKLRMQEPFKIIVWKTLEDTKQAMEDINYNFKKIEEQLSF
tara:strand:- start:255 stop:476 length:222 start_codon:yes stop_codon:yes gene_type:complete